MKSPLNSKKKTISSNLELILLHSAFTPIKFSPTYLHQKNIQSRGQNQGKRTKENLKSNSRSNFSIREVLYTAISLWTIETFLIAREDYYENLDAKSPCGEQVRIQFTWHVSMGILLIRVSTGQRIKFTVDCRHGFIECNPGWWRALWRGSEFLMGRSVLVRRVFEVFIYVGACSRTASTFATSFRLFLNTSTT